MDQVALLECMGRLALGIERVHACNDLAAADAAVLALLREHVAVLVDFIGRDRLQAAIARAAGAADGTLSDGKLVRSAPNSDGVVARRAASLAVQLLEPAMGRDASRALITGLRHIGSGARDSGILSRNVPSHVQGDPSTLRYAVMVTRAAAAILFEAVRGDVPGMPDEMKAHLRQLVEQIGIAPAQLRSVVKLEIALLRYVGVALEEKQWERAKEKQTAAEREAVCLARAIARNRMSADDVVREAGSQASCAARALFRAASDALATLRDEMPLLRLAWQRAKS